MNFDLHGNLQPYAQIETTLEEMQQFFVDNFPNSKERKRIFENYISYVAELKSLVNIGFYQFVNGSFVTKKRTPNDLDLVTFLDYSIYETNEMALKRFKTNGVFGGIDAYIEKVYPKEHPFFIRFQSDQLYWSELFSRGRDGHKKGFLKIVFNHAEK